MNVRYLALVGMLLTVTAPVGAKVKTPTSVPPQMSKLLACRALTAAADRLACFDRESAIVGTAIQRQDLVAFDREAVTRTRRTLFGFSIPDLGLFGANDTDEVKAFDGVVASARRGPYGNWVLRLVDGGTWEQSDDSPLGSDPHKGSAVHIRRGALGSFIMRVDNQPGFKVKRIG